MGNNNNKEGMDVIETEASGSRTAVETQKEFLETFEKELTQEDIHNVKELFNMIEVSLEDVNNYHFKFMKAGEFAKIFKKEIATSDGLADFPTSIAETRTTKERLKHHCFAVIINHLEMVKHISNPKRIDTLLQSIALSHCFLKNPKTSFKTHEVLFKKFLQKEFGKYMNRNMHKATKTFLKLVHMRLLKLVEQLENKTNSSASMEARMQQRHFVRQKAEQVTSLTQLYSNPTPSNSSSIMDFQNVT